jgi:hypothetical protein
MPPKRTRKLDIFNENAEAPTRSSPRNAKRKRLDSGDKPASQPKRHALEDKTRAANSRDTSFRDVKQESFFIDDQPFKQESKGSVLRTEHRHTSGSKTVSPLQDVLKPGTGIFKHLESHSSDIHHLQSLVDEERFQEAADFITKKGSTLGC